MSLFFPGPSGSGQVSLSSTTNNNSTHQHQLNSVPEEGSTTLTRRQPPRNFAEARSLARELRQPKTPFVQRRGSAGGQGGARGNGKERDLSLCSIEQIQEMLEKNTKLLESYQVMAALPDQGAKIRDHQLRLEVKLQQLVAVSGLRQDFANTKIDDSEDIKPTIKPEEEEAVMHTTVEGEHSFTSSVGSAADGFAISPQTKRRLTDRAETQQPHSLVNSMSFAESLRLQREAAKREQERRAAADLAAQRRDQSTGHLLKNALAKDSALDDFMFHADSDEEEEEEEEDFGGVNANALDEEEEAQLNPLRTAYQEGWERAANEASAEAATRVVKGEDHEMAI